MSKERGFDLGRHVLPDGRSFVVKRSPLKYAEVYELHYQGQVAHFRPDNFERAKTEFDLQAPLRLGGNDGSQDSPEGDQKGRGSSEDSVRGHGREGDDRRGSESD